jgi:hypothetical protein
MQKVEMLEGDYKKGVFTSYQPLETSFKYRVTNIEEAISASAVHDRLHLSYVNVMKRVLKSQNLLAT